MVSEQVRFSASFLYDDLKKKNEVNKDELKNAYLNLYEHNKELTDSMVYASVLQQGLLPKKRHFNRLVSESFIIYEPFHYVSGDFYWLAQKEDKVYFAAVDCTGHGVPGAMLTMLGHSFLNYIVLNKGLTSVDEVLQELDKKLIETYAPAIENGATNDWMDISLCCFDKKEKKLHYSGANRKILFVSGDQHQILSGSRYPIGGWQIEDERKYPSQTVTAEKGDTVYLGSDGFQDQFGGSRLKKYSSKKLHETILKISHLSLAKQADLLKEEFKSWKGAQPQVDDICLLGIKL